MPCTEEKNQLYFWNYKNTKIKTIPHLQVLPFEAALFSFSSRSAPRQLKMREEKNKTE